jgi:hypothetical protein
MGVGALDLNGTIIMSLNWDILRVVKRAPGRSNPSILVMQLETRGT